MNMGPQPEREFGTKSQYFTQREKVARGFLSKANKFHAPLLLDFMRTYEAPAGEVEHFSNKHGHKKYVNMCQDLLNQRREEFVVDIEDIVAWAGKRAATMEENGEDSGTFGADVNALIMGTRS